MHYLLNWALQPTVRPVEDVFRFVTDFGKTAEWVTELQETKNVSNGPAGLLSLRWGHIEIS